MRKVPLVCCRESVSQSILRSVVSRLTVGGRIALTQPSSAGAAHQAGIGHCRQCDQATASRMSSGYGKYGPACLFRQLLSSKFFRPKTRLHEPSL